MHYNLEFFTQKTKPISHQQIIDYILRLENFTPTGNSFLYKNAQTATSFSINLSDLDESEAKTQNLNFADFAKTSFICSIDLPCPNFFGREFSFVVEKIQNVLDLFIFNNQSQQAPKKYTAEEIFKDWQATNFEKGNNTFDAKQQLAFLDRKKSDMAWNYAFNRENLIEKLGETLYVPEMFFMKLFNNEELFTMVVWPEHIPLVLPKVDYIYVIKKIRKLFKKQEIKGVIKYEDMMHNLGKYFTDFEEHKILAPELSDKLAKEFNNLPLISRENIEDVSNFNTIAIEDKLIEIDSSKIDTYTAERKKATNKDELNAPGWICIDKSLEKLYASQVPLHIESAVKYRFGGYNPLDATSIYTSQQQEKHFHIISYGMSDLYGENTGTEFSKFGFEFTMRIAAKDSSDEDQTWALEFIRNLAKYVFESGKCFNPYNIAISPDKRPICLDKPTNLCAIAFVLDPELGKIQTPSGELQFLQIVGLTQKEYDKIAESEDISAAAENLLQQMQKTNPLLITDLDRKD